VLLNARCALLNGELGKYTPVVALRIIAGAGGGRMNPQVLSGPELSTVNCHRENCLLRLSAASLPLPHVQVWSAEEVRR
jgi:hypothetical protein